MGTWEARTVGGSTLGLYHSDETVIPRMGEAITVRHPTTAVITTFEVVRVEHWPADRAVVVTCSPRPPSTHGYGGAQPVAPAWAEGEPV